MGGGHWSYVLAAYAAAIVVIGGLLAAVLLDHRALRAALERLQARGVRRRAAEVPTAEPALRREA